MTTAAWNGAVALAMLCLVATGVIAVNVTALGSLRATTAIDEATPQGREARQRLRSLALALTNAQQYSAKVQRATSHAAKNEALQLASSEFHRIVADYGSILESISAGKAAADHHVPEESQNALPRWKTWSQFRRDAMEVEAAARRQRPAPNVVYGGVPFEHMLAGDAELCLGHMLLAYGTAPWDAAADHLQRAAELNPYSFDCRQLLVEATNRRGLSVLQETAHTESSVDDFSTIPESRAMLRALVSSARDIDGVSKGRASQGEWAGAPAPQPDSSCVLYALVRSFGVVPTLLADAGQEGRFLREISSVANAMVAPLQSEMPKVWQQDCHGTSVPWFMAPACLWAPTGSTALDAHAALRRVTPWVSYVAAHLRPLFVDDAGTEPVWLHFDDRQCRRANVVARVVPKRPTAADPNIAVFEDGDRPWSTRPATAPLARAPVHEPFWAPVECTRSFDWPPKPRGSQGRVMFPELPLSTPISAEARALLDLILSPDVRVGVLTSHPEASHIEMRAFEGTLPIGEEGFDIKFISLPGRDKAKHVSKRIAPTFVDLDGQSLSEMRGQLSGMRLHVLMFIEHSTSDHLNLLAMSRLAPMQIMMAGVPTTSGVRTVDEFLGATTQNAVAADLYHTERKVFRTRSRTGFYFKAPKLPPIESRRRRSDFGIPDDVHVYMCAQSSFKVTPRLDAVFARILQRDPKGYVVLIGHAERPHYGPMIRRRLSRTIPQEAVRARIIVLDGVGPPDVRTGEPRYSLFFHYIDLLLCADVMLDSMPTGGGATALENLALGVPTVNLPLQTPYSKQVQRYYRVIGEYAMLAGDEDEYVAIAVRLGTDSSTRNRVSRRIKRRAAQTLYEDGSALAEHRSLLRSRGDQARAMALRALGFPVGARGVELARLAAAAMPESVGLSPQSQAVNGDSDVR